MATNDEIDELIWENYKTTTHFPIMALCRVCRDPKMAYCQCAKARYLRGVTDESRRRFLDKQELKKYLNLITGVMPDVPKDDVLLRGKLDKSSSSMKLSPNNSTTNNITTSDKGDQTIMKTKKIRRRTKKKKVVKNDTSIKSDITTKSSATKKPRRRKTKKGRSPISEDKTQINPELLTKVNKTSPGGVTPEVHKKSYGPEWNVLHTADVTPSAPMEKLSKTDLQINESKNFDKDDSIQSQKTRREISNYKKKKLANYKRIKRIVENIALANKKRFKKSVLKSNNFTSRKPLKYNTRDNTKNNINNNEKFKISNVPRPMLEKVMNYLTKKTRSERIIKDYIPGDPDKRQLLGEYIKLSEECDYMTNF